MKLGETSAEEEEEEEPFTCWDPRDDLGIMNCMNWQDGSRVSSLIEKTTAYKKIIAEWSYMRIKFISAQQRNL